MGGVQGTTTKYTPPYTLVHVGYQSIIMLKRETTRDFKLFPTVTSGVSPECLPNVFRSSPECLPNVSCMSPECLANVRVLLRLRMVPSLKHSWRRIGSQSVPAGNELRIPFQYGWRR